MTACSTVNRYRYPVRIDQRARISYEESPAHVGRLKHSVDFIVEEGTPVVAAADGTVIDLKSDSDIGGLEPELESFGNFVELKHEHGECSEYEHLKKDMVLVRVGDKVTCGQVIGYSGATGWLAHLGPHLHFMVGRYGESDEDYETLKIIWEYE